MSATSEASIPEQPTLVIDAKPGWTPIDLAELWRHRDLIWLLTLRTVKVRYTQSLLGVTWAVVKPVVTMVVFTLLLGALLGRGNLPSEEGIPYALSTFCGLVPWQLFARGMSASSMSLAGYRYWITKVYFPRLILPLTPLLAALVDFGIALVVLLGLGLFFGVTPGLGILALPLFILMALAAALAVGVWLASLHALWRDVGHGVGFLVQLWMFATPVIYSTESVMHGRPQWLQVLYSLNPMAGVVEGFRWALIGGSPPPWELVGCSAAGVVLSLVVGLYFFRRMEYVVADLV